MNPIQSAGKPQVILNIRAWIQRIAGSPYHNKSRIITLQESDISELPSEEKASQFPSMFIILRDGSSQIRFVNDAVLSNFEGKK